MSYNASNSLQVRLEDVVNNVRNTAGIILEHYDNQSFAEAIERAFTERLADTRFTDCFIHVRAISSPLAHRQETDLNEIRFTSVPVIKRSVIAETYVYELMFVLKIMNVQYCPNGSAENKSRVLIENYTDFIFTELFDYLLIPNPFVIYRA